MQLKKEVLNYIMTSKEKMEIIESKITLLNVNVLRNKDFKIKYQKNGRKYSLAYITQTGQNLGMADFNTYDDVLAALDLLEILFTRRDTNENNN